MINIGAAWIGFLLGGVAGAVPGLFFYDKEWLGGYASWRRRMIRLGHIAFFGLGFLNLGFGLTCRSLALESGVGLASALLIVGAIAMPARPTIKNATLQSSMLAMTPPKTMPMALPIGIPKE